MSQVVDLRRGDCRALLADMPAASVDAVVTDPPYELGFMGQAWDRTGVAFDPVTWRAALRVLKPGGHLLAFGGSRTYHRMACAIEDAGFDIRDQIMWIYGSGFPKSHDVSKAIDRAAGVEREVVGSTERRVGPQGSRKVPGLVGSSTFRENPDHPGNLLTVPATAEAAQWEGWGTALKPAHEPIVLARKPLAASSVAANVLAHGTGALNIDACRVGTDEDDLALMAARSHPNGTTAGSRGGAIIPLGDKPAGFVPSALGRCPANVIHDGSDEVVALFPASTRAGERPARRTGLGFASAAAGTTGERVVLDTGSAARFFYCAKASRADRDEGLDAFDEQQVVQFQTANGTSGEPSSLSAGRDTRRRNTHPTVKPTALMRYLCRLITPPGGTVLDPFAGSGSTGKAAVLEGFGFIGCELDADYIAIASARIAHALVGGAIAPRRRRRRVAHG